ncbi:MAG: RNA 3'-terminal phosphate cyclase [Candidatus Bathyarchaeia archaeon]
MRFSLGAGEWWLGRDNRVIEIDGSILEGGGQILRVSTGISAVTLKPLRVINIRAKRSPPGLRPQHLTATKAIAELVKANLHGAKLGSQLIEFTPEKHRAGSFQFDTGTAGSTTLILQALMPAACFAPGPVAFVVKGGTNNPWAPPIDYLQQVLLPVVRRMGLDASVQTARRGFYPIGGGVVEAAIQPTQRVMPLTAVERGKLQEIRGLLYSSRLPRHILDRMATAAEKILSNAGYPPPRFSLEHLDSPSEKCALSPGCGIVLVAEFEGGALIGTDALGERGKPAEKVAGEAAQAMLTELDTGGYVDRHLADQLIVWMSLAEGVSEITVGCLTLHTLTSIEVCRTMLPVKFHVEGELNKPARIRCEGAGLRNAYL